MCRTNIFLKIEVEHDTEEKPEQIAGELCRQIAKVYGVRTAELTHFTVIEE